MKHQLMCYVLIIWYAIVHHEMKHNIPVHTETNCASLRKPDKSLCQNQIYKFLTKTLMQPMTWHRPLYVYQNGPNLLEDKLILIAI